MRKELKEKKRIKLHNKKLCKKYPWLIPSAHWYSGRILKKCDWNYSWTWWDEMPNGWKKCFGNMMLEELDAAIRKSGLLNEFSIDQLKEKYGCYDDKTEILTKSGWKLFIDLTYEDQIMTLNPTNEKMEYQYPTEIITEKYTGKMYHLENRGLSIVVTPNHNLYVAKGSYYYASKNNKKIMYDMELTTPNKYFGKDKRFKKAGGIWEGLNNYGDNFLIRNKPYKNTTEFTGERLYLPKDLSINMMSWMRFLGFYIAEGYSNIKFNDLEHHSNESGNILIAYDYHKEEELAKKLIIDIGFNPKKDAEGLMRFSNICLAKWLKENCGHKAFNKKVPSFIKELPSIYIEEFLKYLYLGDGYKAETSNILTTTSKQLSNDVQELLIKCGYAFREKIKDKRGYHGNDSKGRPIINKHIVYEINWLKLKDIEIDNSKVSKSFIEQWEDYKGFVFCVTVPNHIIYVRRNGKGVWCGNSLRTYYHGFNDEIEQIFNKYEYISANVCILCGKPDTPMINDSWISPYCWDCFLKFKKKDEDWYIKNYKNYIPQTNEEIYKEYIAKASENNQMADSYTIKRWTDNDTIETTYDISETAEKIRRRYAKMHRKSSKRLCSVE